MERGEKVRLPAVADQAAAGTITPEGIQSYLDALSGRGRSRGTVQIYGAKLQTFYSWLPPDKRVGPRTLADWRAALLAEGYSPSTVNTHLSAANGLLEHLGRRDLQLVGRLDPEPGIQPELTRTEYLRLLQAARALEKERTYLLVKTFALVGLRVGELSRLTVERVKAGRLPVDGETRRTTPIPGCLRSELLDYARRQGLRTGPVFVTRNGKVMNRTQVTAEVQALGRTARVDESKCNPRCLRKLCQAARTDVERSVRLLAEQSYERMLDTEQLAAGWMEEASFTGREHRAESFQGHREEAEAG